jgi:hypothetical protein
MKLAIFLSLALASAPLFAADAGTKDEVKAAAKKLAEAPNYSWTSTTESAGGNQGNQGNQGAGRFRIGPTEGKTQKDGLTAIKMTRGENATEAVIKGGKSAVKTENGWKTADELSADSSADNNAQQGNRRRGGGQFLGRMLQNIKTPAVQAEELVGKVKELKKAEDAYSGDLTDEAVKELLTFGGGRRPGGNEPPAPTNTSGAVKFWLKDGALAKYEIKVQGTMSFNNNERNIGRTTTVEIKDVGSTKVEVPEEAKAKVSS